MQIPVLSCMHVCATNHDDPVPYQKSCTIWQTQEPYPHVAYTYLPNTVSLPALSGPSNVPSGSCALHEYTPASCSCTEFLDRERVGSIPLLTIVPSWSHSMLLTGWLSLHVVGWEKKSVELKKYCTTINTGGKKYGEKSNSKYYDSMIVLYSEYQWVYVERHNHHKSVHCPNSSVKEFQTDCQKWVLK